MGALPAHWIACSKPSSAKITPLVLIADSTPRAPNGAKPCELKLWPWNSVAAKITMVTTGMATFHQVAALLVRASHLTPKKLIPTKRASSAAATAKPDAVSVESLGCCRPSAQLQCRA